VLLAQTLYFLDLCTGKQESMIFPLSYTLTKSKPNKAVLWKITLQMMENSLVEIGIFISPLIRFLYSSYAGKVFQSLDRIITGIDEVYKNLGLYTFIFQNI